MLEKIIMLISKSRFKKRSCFPNMSLRDHYDRGNLSSSLTLPGTRLRFTCNVNSPNRDLGDMYFLTMHRGSSIIFALLPAELDPLERKYKCK